MAKPQNPIIAQKKLEAMLNKNTDKIKKMTEDKNFITAKIAFLAVTNYIANYSQVGGSYYACSRFEELYNKIKDLDNLDEIIKICNDTLIPADRIKFDKTSVIITKEELETAWPKDFLTYSSM